MNPDASTVEDINIHRIIERVSMSCIASLKIGAASFAIDHSPCARMTVTLEKDSILWRCQLHIAKTGSWRCCQPPVGCSRLLSAANDPTATNLKQSWKSTCLRGFKIDGTHNALYTSSVVDSLVNCHELHQELLQCHQLEEELDDECHCWYFQHGTGLSCLSPDSWWRRLNVVNASLKSERSLTGPIFPDLSREIHQFFLYRKYSSCVIRQVTGYRLLQFDHVRVDIHEIWNLSRNDRESIQNSSWCISFSNYGQYGLFVLWSSLNDGHEVVHS